MPIKSRISLKIKISSICSEINLKSTNENERGLFNKRMGIIGFRLIGTNRREYKMIILFWRARESSKRNRPTEEGLNTYRSGKVSIRSTCYHRSTRNRRKKSSIFLRWGRKNSTKKSTNTNKNNTSSKPKIFSPLSNTKRNKSDKNNKTISPKSAKKEPTSSNKPTKNKKC